MKQFLQKKITQGVVGISFMGIAGVTYAQSFGGGSATSFRELVNSIGTILSTRVVPILISIAVLVFIINIGQYIINLDNEKQREQFKKYSINSILAIFILLSLWAIVGIGTQLFFSRSPIIPQLPTSGN